MVRDLGQPLPGLTLPRRDFLYLTALTHTGVVGWSTFLHTTFGQGGTE